MSEGSKHVDRRASSRDHRGSKSWKQEEQSPKTSRTADRHKTDRDREQKSEVHDKSRQASRVQNVLPEKITRDKVRRSSSPCSASRDSPSRRDCQNTSDEHLRSRNRDRLPISRHNCSRLTKEAARETPRSRYSYEVHKGSVPHSSSSRQAASHNEDGNDGSTNTDLRRESSRRFGQDRALNSSPAVRRNSPGRDKTPGHPRSERIFIKRGNQPRENEASMRRKANNAHHVLDGRAANERTHVAVGHDDGRKELLGRHNSAVESPKMEGGTRPASTEAHTSEQRSFHTLPPPPPTATDASLDFLSADFDAAKALRTPGLQPPNPKVRPLNTFGQCRFILPPELEESLAEFKPTSSRTNEELLDAKARSGPARVRREAEELKGSALERIAESITKGPLLLLRRCYKTSARVRIVTRHSRGVRGTATGTLKAFDKFMNLVLQEVEESYTVRLKVQRSKFVLQPIKGVRSDEAMTAESLPNEFGGIASESAGYETVEKTRTVFKQEQRSRKLKQIFVRGSNIVMISTVPTAASMQAA